MKLFVRVILLFVFSMGYLKTVIAEEDMRETHYIGVPGVILTQLNSASGKGERRVFQGKVRIEMLAANRTEAFNAILNPAPRILHDLNLLVSKTPYEEMETGEGQVALQALARDVVAGILSQNAPEIEVVDVLFIEYIIR
ncbi:MAG: flagellar basal body-associated FliL family protein [Pseudomonadota bacterium]